MTEINKTSNKAIKTIKEASVPSFKVDDNDVANNPVIGINADFTQDTFNKGHDHDGENSRKLRNFDDINCKRINLKGILNLVAVDYNDGTAHPAGAPESLNEPQEGWMYCRNNYDTGSEDNIRVYIGGAWRSITTT